MLWKIFGEILWCDFICFGHTLADIAYGRLGLLAATENAVNSRARACHKSAHSSAFVKTALDFLRGEAEADEVTAQAFFQTRGNAKPKYLGAVRLLLRE